MLCWNCYLLGEEKKLISSQATLTKQDLGTSLEFFSKFPFHTGVPTRACATPIIDLLIILLRPFKASNATSF